MEPTNQLDQLTNDSTKIVITTKTVKWIFGIVFGGILSILGFAWSLYVKVDLKVEGVKTDIISKMEELEKERVKPVESKNIVQDLDIVRLFERTAQDNASRIPQTVINSGELPPSMQNSK